MRSICCVVLYWCIHGKLQHKLMLAATSREIDASSSQGLEAWCDLSSSVCTWVLLNSSKPLTMTNKSPLRFSDTVCGNKGDLLRVKYGLCVGLGPSTSVGQRLESLSLQCERAFHLCCFKFPPPPSVNPASHWSQTCEVDLEGVPQHQSVPSWRGKGPRFPWLPRPHELRRIGYQLNRLH